MMSKLGSYAQDWQNAPIETSDFITPEDGRYRVIIDDVTYTEQDKDGRETYPTFVYTFTITEGDCKGQRFRRFSSIRNERSAGFIKGDLQKLGIPIPRDVEALPEQFMSARGYIIDVSVKTKEVNGKPYKDIYIDKLIGRAQPRQQQPRPQPQQYQPQPQQYQQPQTFSNYAPVSQQYPQPPQTFGGGYPSDDEIPF